MRNARRYGYAVPALFAVLAGCNDDYGLPSLFPEMGRPATDGGPPDLPPPPPPPDFALPDMTVPPPPLDFAGCPAGTRSCGMRCIPLASCCTNEECVAAGQVCQMDGTCQCPIGQKACLQTCIPNVNCCTNADCPTKACLSGMCVMPASADGFANGNETDIDCGGGFCTRCLATRNCGLALDCRSNQCLKNECVEASFDRSDWGGGAGPRFLRTGDLDNDGNADVLSLNGISYNLSTMLGRGDGTFTSLGSFTTGLAPVQFDLGDFDRDGRLDVVTANSSSYDISILMGNGDGTFKPQRLEKVASTPTWVAVGDQNHDGRQDIVVANSVTGSIGLLLGKGDGTFNRPVEVFTPISRPRAVVLKDFNGDGFDDVAVQCVGFPRPGQMAFNTGVISVYLSKPAGGFALPVQYPTANTQLTSLFAQDLNSDGKLDLMVGSFNLTAPQVFLGDGMGRFQLAGALPVMYAPWVQFGDMNGDKIVDLISSSGLSLGIGNGAFQPAVAWPNVGVGSTSVAVADYNRDNKLDVAMPALSANSVLVLFGNGDGTLQLLAPPKSGSDTDIALISPRATAVADVSGDTRADVLVASGPTNMTTTPALVVRLANPNGTLQAPVVYGFGSLGTGSPSGIAVADFNGDRNLDVVVSSASDTNAYYFAGAGNGGLKAAVKIHMPTTMQTVTAADLNLDGKQDLILATTGTQVYYQLGKGDGTFNNAVPLTVGTQPRQILIMDFNGDMNLDIITVNRGSSNLSFCLSKGVDMNGVLSFNTAVTQAPPGMPAPAPIAAGIADLDGDTLPDLVIADNAAAFVRVYLNKTAMGGAITFGPPTSYATLAIPIAGVMADFNQDGLLDFATANNTDRSISLFLGKGQGLFSQMVNHDVGIVPVAISAGDINSDKKADLVTANQTANTVSVLLSRF